MKKHSPPYSDRKMLIISILLILGTILFGVLWVFVMPSVVYRIQYPPTGAMPESGVFYCEDILTAIEFVDGTAKDAFRYDSVEKEAAEAVRTCIAYGSTDSMSIESYDERSEEFIKYAYGKYDYDGECFYINGSRKYTFVKTDFSDIQEMTEGMELKYTERVYPRD